MAERIGGKYWLAMVYPESAPSDWVQYLHQTGVKFAVSPLHDRDVWITDTDDHRKGEKKKAHYHVLIVYPNSTTLSCIKQLFSYCKTQRIIKCVDPAGSVNYWPHDEDDLEAGKALYDPDDIKFYNGLDLNEVMDLSEQAEDEIVFAIKKIIRENQFVEYAQLDDYLELDQGWPELHRYCRKHTIYLNSYLKSRRYTNPDITDYLNLKEQFEKLKKQLEEQG